MRARPRRMNSNVRASLIVSVPPLYGPPSGLRCCMLPFLLPAAKMLVQLRDGRKIIGIMRSFDQFANIVLEGAIERVIVGKRFADVPLGLYVIRGENVVLLGQIVRPPSRSYLFARDMFIHKLTYLPVLARTGRCQKKRRQQNRCSQKHRSTSCWQRSGRRRRLSGSRPISLAQPRAQPPTRGTSLDRPLLEHVSSISQRREQKRADQTKHTQTWSCAANM